MINLSRNIISNIFLFAVVFILLPVSWYFFLGGKEQFTKTPKVSLYEELPDFLSQLNRRWRYGDIEGHWGSDRFQCSDIPILPDNIHLDFLRCNPAYLKCVFSGQIKSIDSNIKTKSFKFNADLNSFLIVERGDLKIDFIEKNTKKAFSVKLENYCHNSFLPQKVYSAGLDNYSEDLWDNYNRQLFVDKNYVTNWDIEKWKTGKFEVSTKYLVKPSLDLSLQKRKEYCHSVGKTLLQSHIFDAVSFYPSKIENDFLFKSKYPWSKSNRFDVEKIEKENCKKLYSSECRKTLSIKSYSNLSVGWSGIYNILSQEMESFENIFHKKANLKVSNASLKRNSDWHANGLRANWNGLYLSKNSFEFLEQGLGRAIIVDKIGGVAFRCLDIK
jgi:hypothetical protein